jgi:hypothetical protein
VRVGADLLTRRAGARGGCEDRRMSTTATGPRVALSIAEPVTTLGGSLDGTVTVAGELDEKVRGLRVELLYVNEYLYEERQQSGRDNNGNVQYRTVQVTGTADVVVQTLSFDVENGPIDGAHEVQLWVPEDAPPTAATLVRWKVRAVVDRKLGNDVTAETRVVVRSTVDHAPAAAASDPSVDEQLGLTIGERALKPGDTLTGTLVVAPEKDVKFTDVRVELQARRHDQDGIVSGDVVAELTVSGKVEVAGGERHEFPFELQVPVDAIPAFVAANNRVTYAFVASGARRLRSDYNATADVYVCSEES